MASFSSVFLFLLLVSGQDADILGLAENALTRPSANLLQIKAEIEKNQSENRSNENAREKGDSSLAVGKWIRPSASARCGRVYIFHENNTWEESMLDTSGKEFWEEVTSGKWEWVDKTTIQARTTSNPNYPFKIIFENQKMALVGSDPKNRERIQKVSKSTTRNLGHTWGYPEDYKPYRYTP